MYTLLGSVFKSFDREGAFVPIHLDEVYSSFPSFKGKIVHISKMMKGFKKNHR